MSSPPTTQGTGKIVSLERSPAYWLRRAEGYHRRGDHRREAALLRHAAAMEPTSGEVRLQYAQALRHISCYEASNREAFGALAQQPNGYEAYQLIGSNMLSLGQEQEAMDAFARYMQQVESLAEVPPLEGDEDELYAIETVERAGHRKARYEAALHMASLRMARQDLPGAERALARAQRLGQDIRLLVLRAMHLQAADRKEEALRCALQAVGPGCRYIPALCALAGMYLDRGRPGDRKQAGQVLLRGLAHCYYPHQEQLFCMTADALGMSSISLGMLRYNRRKNPDRLPTLFNLAVVLLHQGRVEDGAGLLNCCRELDPEDITVHYVVRAAAQWLELARAGEPWQGEVEGLSYYPALAPAQESQLLEGLANHLSMGLPGFAAALAANGMLYRSFLYALGLPSMTLGRLLLPVALEMGKESRPAGEGLLRDVLWQCSGNQDTQRYALSALMAYGAQPPYGIQRNGRLLHAGPQEGEVFVPQSRVVRRLNRVADALQDNRVILHGLALLRRMNPYTRYAFAMDGEGLWSQALALHFTLAQGEPGPVFPPLSQEQERRRRRMLHRLSQLWPLSGQGAPAVEGAGGRRRGKRVSKGRAEKPSIPTKEATDDGTYDVD